MLYSALALHPKHPWSGGTEVFGGSQNDGMLRREGATGPALLRGESAEAEVTPVQYCRPRANDMTLFHPQGEPELHQPVYVVVPRSESERSEDKPLPFLASKSHARQVPQASNREGRRLNTNIKPQPASSK